MSDINMLTAYSWAAGLSQQQLPSSLMDIEKRAKLVNEINGPLVRGNNPLVADKMLLIDLDNDEKDLRLNDIAQISMAFLTEQMTGIQTSLQEQDIQQYLNKVIEEIKEKGCF